MNQKIKLRIFQPILIGLISFTFHACTKVSSEVPKLTTADVTSIKLDSAICGGKITLDGGSDIIVKGVCWSVKDNPTIADSKTENGSGKGSFQSIITGLLPNTVYYLRAYARNYSKEGTGYGNTVTFKTDSLFLGSQYQGGTVAYILKPGDEGYDSTYLHGIIAAPTDQSKGIPWGIGFALYTGASETNIGFGFANTNHIVKIQDQGIYAAKLCSDLVIGNYSDWYLPTIDELHELYKKRVMLGGFDNAFYWSSSDILASFAMCEDFGSGGIKQSQIKSLNLNVRAVRSF